MNPYSIPLRFILILYFLLRPGLPAWSYFALFRTLPVLNGLNAVVCLVPLRGHQVGRDQLQSNWRAVPRVG
jgi:hypothetical protein